MQTTTKRILRLYGKGLCLGVAMCALLMTSGCASTQRTHTETTATYPDDGYNEGTVQTTETETTTTTETADGSGGIISSTVNAIGWVIALPFRIVGGLINMIF